MILEVNNLTKSFNDQILFEDFSYIFKENSLYVILGESGSGKSTLLNILSLIDGEYSGSFKIDGLPVNEMKDNQLESIRALNFGYVFQNFNLFEDDTVKNNIRIFFDGVVDIDEDAKSIIIDETLKKLGIYELSNFYVRDLSGGEKQRVAIARAIINSPKVVFCDEPTGSLDTLNTENIFNILKSISNDTIVICVTHDEENAYKYADNILKFENNKITSTKNETKNKEEFLLARVEKKKPNAILKMKYLFKHILSKIKIHKIRNLIRSALVIISFVVTGISLSLTSGVHDSLMNSFGSVIDSKTLILNKKACKNTILDYYSTSKSDIVALSKVYSDYIDYYGCNYLVDFENNFCDGNDLYLNVKGYLKKFSGFNIRMFNEFIYEPNLNNLETYPEITGPLNNDEIVLSISYEQMKELCLSFQILRNFETLGEYLENNNVYLTLQLKNRSWGYSDEQIFRLKGVIFNRLNRVFHTNNLFNEVLFENNMRMPVSYSPLRVEAYPWVMKKVYYIHTRQFQNEFLDSILYDNNRDNLLFDSETHVYSPLNCSYDTKVTNRVYVYSVIKDTIEIDMIEHMKELGIDFEGYYFSSQSGYYNNGTSLFSGFAKRIFFSSDLNKNEQIIDAYSKIEEKDLDKISMPKGVVDGYALKANSSNVRLKVFKGEEKLRANEIVISKGFKKILDEEEIIEKDLYTTLMKSSTYYNGKITNNFETIKLKVKGVIETDESVSIYQKPEFSLSLFRDFFKVSGLNLVPTSIIFEAKTSLNKDEIDKLNKYFSDYELSNPLYVIEESINDSTKFLKILLLIFSGLSIISSLILLFIISIISAIEQRKEISIYKVLGFSNFEVLKMFLLENGLTTGVSFLISIVSLLFVSIIGQGLFKTALGIENLVIFSPLALIFNLLLAIILTLASSIGAYKEIKNVNIVKEIH